LLEVRNVTKKLVVRENHAVYLVDTETGEEQPMALVPQEEYQVFLAWREAQEQARQRQTEQDAFEREREAFERLEPSLLEKYKGRYVAVRDGQVVGIDDDLALLQRVYDTLGHGIVYIRKVGESLPVCRIHSPRIA
jgi:hypothetical protein